MSDGLIGLNAGKIYLSTLVGFGFCHRQRFIYEHVVYFSVYLLPSIHLIHLTSWTNSDTSGLSPCFWLWVLPT